MIIFQMWTKSYFCVYFKAGIKCNLLDMAQQTTTLRPPANLAQEEKMPILSLWFLYLRHILQRAENHVEFLGIQYFTKEIKAEFGVSFQVVGKQLTICGSKEINSI